MNIQKRLIIMVILSIATSLATVISIFESMIPAFPMLPPGAKIGLSNIVTMYIASYFGVIPAVIIAVLKSIFVGFTRGFIAFIMSFSGSVLSTIVTGTLLRLPKKFIGYIGIGIIGALVHNISQLVVSSIITTSLIFVYIPWFIIISIITGVFTGVTLTIVKPVLDRLNFRSMH